MKLSILLAVLSVVALAVAMPPAEVEGPVYIWEPDYMGEPAYIGEPVHIREPAYNEEPVHAEEPVQIGEPVDNEEPVHFEEPVYIEELDNGVESLGRNILLHSASVSLAAIPNTVRVLNWSWRGAAARRISSWRAVVVGQSATITRTAGGVGTNNLSLRITSGVGRGFSYRLEVYGS